jgi:hypothetical protein
MSARSVDLAVSRFVESAAAVVVELEARPLTEEVAVQLLGLTWSTRRLKRTIG